MTRLLRLFIFATLLTVTFVPPALARLVVGVSPAVSRGATDRDLLAALESAWSASLGQPLQLRSLDSEAAVLEWLLRFRELDAAVVSRRQLQSLPAGTLINLGNLPGPEATVLVSHHGVAPQRVAELRDSFRALVENSGSASLLTRLGGGAARTVPVEKAFQATTPAPGSILQKPEPSAAPAPTSVTPPPVPAPASAPAPAKAPVSPQAAKSPPPRAPILATPPATPQQPPPTAATPTAPPRRSTRLAVFAALIILAGMTVKLFLLARHWQDKKKRVTAPPETPSAEVLAPPRKTTPAPRTPRPRPARQLSTEPTAETVVPPTPELVAELPVLSGLPSGNELPPLTEPSLRDELPPLDALPALNEFSEPDDLPSFGELPGPNDLPALDELPEPDDLPAFGELPEPDDLPTFDEPPLQETASSVVPVAEVNDNVIETGELSNGMVPALLRRCATMSDTVTLRVRRRGSEKCVRFARGQILHSSSRELRDTGSSRQWHKLGYLMIRDGYLTETQRDQALERVDQGLSSCFCTALLELGSIDQASLQETLSRQAKNILFGLVLFPEGEYRIEANSEPVPEEELVALDFADLLREASLHQSEWTAIRKVLPNLGVLLDYTDQGREKLAQARMSVHQQLLLWRVDGKTPLGALFLESTMMDYEVARFAFLMVKSGVLRVT